MFSKQLKQLRKQHNITQEALAALINVDRSSIGKYEGRSAVVPPADVLERIADVFNVSVDYLLGRDNASSLPQSTGGTWVPVLGRVAAGIPIEAIEEVEDYEEISPDMAKTGEFFAYIFRRSV